MKVKVNPGTGTRLPETVMARDTIPTNRKQR